MMPWQNDSAMEAVSENKEDANLSSSLMSENLGLKIK